MHNNQPLDTWSGNFAAVCAPQGDKMNEGGKVLLPQSVLTALASLNVMYPLQFRIESYKSSRMYGGVLEFTATEGQVVFPKWMMNQLKLAAGDPVRLSTAALPIGGLVKLRPREYKFTELSNPKAVLEHVLSRFSCLTKSDTFPIFHAGETFTFDVMEVRTNSNSLATAVSIVETDLKVDFDRPLDMPEEPKYVPSTAKNVIGGAGAPVNDINFKPMTDYRPPTLGHQPNMQHSGVTPQDPGDKNYVMFGGPGHQLKGGPPISPVVQSTTPPEGVPPMEHKFEPFQGGGRTISGKPAAPVEVAEEPPKKEEPDHSAFQPFAGNGRSLSGKTPATTTTTSSSTATSQPPTQQGEFHVAKSLSGKPVVPPTTQTVEASKNANTQPSGTQPESQGFQAFGGKGRSLKS